MVTIQDVEFYIPFELSLFRTKSKSFTDESVIDHSILQPYIPKTQPVEPYLDQQTLQNFDKLQGLVLVLDQSISEAYVQKSIEISALIVAASSISYQYVHLDSTSPTIYVVSTTSPITSKPATQPISGIPTSTSPISSSIIQPPKQIMADRYAPLILRGQLNVMPQDYQNIIPQFDATGAITAQQHVDTMNDIFDLQEVYDFDVKMRLFAQSLGGEVKKCFKGLTAGSIVDLDAFH